MAKAKANRASGPITYALIVLNADGKRINGCSSSRDLAGTRRLARNVLTTLPGAACVDIHDYDAKQGGMAAQPLETINLDQEEVL